MGCLKGCDRTGMFQHEDPYPLVRETVSCFDTKRCVGSPCVSKIGPTLETGSFRRMRSHAEGSVPSSQFYCRCEGLPAQSGNCCTKTIPGRMAQRVPKNVPNVGVAYSYPYADKCAPPCTGSICMYFLILPFLLLTRCVCPVLASRKVYVF